MFYASVGDGILGCGFWYTVELHSFIVLCPSGKGVLFMTGEEIVLQNCILVSVQPKGAPSGHTSEPLCKAQESPRLGVR